MTRKTQVVAQEAARLLYFGLVDEYKEAKAIASKALCIHVWPSNFDVALELDKLGDEVEGGTRKDRLLHLRREAFELMSFLEKYRPRLFGSVWRGTALRGSDIDIQVYAPDIDDVLRELRGRYEVTRTEWTAKTAEGRTERFFHAFLSLPDGDEIELSIKDPEGEASVRKDAIYHDSLVGLHLAELREILEKDPVRKFVPKKKIGRKAKK